MNDELIYEQKDQSEWYWLRRPSSPWKVMVRSVEVEKRGHGRKVFQLIELLSVLELKIEIITR